MDVENEADNGDESQPFEIKTNDITEHDDKPTPYVCTVCDKRCRNKARLNRHKRTHTGEKPFVCRVCYKRFTRQEGLNYHKRVHTLDSNAAEKRYSCSDCEKTFASKIALTCHKYIPVSYTHLTLPTIYSV